MELKKYMVIDKSQETTLDSYIVLNYKDRLCVPRVNDLIKKSCL